MEVKQIMFNVIVSIGVMIAIIRFGKLISFCQRL